MVVKAELRGSLQEPALADMAVAVDDARHQSLAGAVDLRQVGRHVEVPAHGADAAVAHHHGDIVEDAQAVEDAHVGDRERIRPFLARGVGPRGVEAESQAGKRGQGEVAYRIHEAPLSLPKDRAGLPQESGPGPHSVAGACYLPQLE